MSETRAYFHNIRDTVTPNTQAFIDGHYCDAADGAKLENLNPACLLYTSPSPRD